MTEMTLPEEPVRLTEAQLRRRKARSVAIAIALAAFVALFYFVTIAKIGGNIASRRPNRRRDVMSEPARATRKLNLGLTAAACAVFVAAMVGASFAAVPLYRMFCQAHRLQRHRPARHRRAGEDARSRCHRPLRRQYRQRPRLELPSAAALA